MEKTREPKSKKTTENPLIKNLSKRETNPVTKAVESLIRKSDTQELIDILKKSEFKPDDMTLLWIIIILGEKQETTAIDDLVDIFRRQSGLLAVAAYDALLAIAKKDSKAVYEACINYLEEFLEALESVKGEEEWSRKETEYKDRVYVYDILGKLREYKKISDSVKEKLIEYTERDYSVNGRIVLNLLRWPLDKDMTSFLKRQLEVALVSRRGVGKMNREYIEAKWALINYTKGKFDDKYPYKKEEKDSPWQERWEPLFKQWEDVKAKENNKDNQPAEKSKAEKDKEMKETIELQKKQQAEVKEFNAFQDPKFSIDEYLKIHIPAEREKEIVKKINDVVENKTFDLKDIQARLGKEKDFYANLNYYLKESGLVSDKEKSTQLAEHIYELWSLTPQEDWHGITPVEKNIYDKTGVKPGRNEPCPCGALNDNGIPKKYKKCCAQKFV